MIRIVRAASFMAALIFAGWAGAVDAAAMPFGPYTAVIAYTDSPAYDFQAMTVDLSGSLSITNGTGAFATVTNGLANGTLSYSSTVGATVIQSVTGLLTFVDPTQPDGAPISFNVTSVSTDALVADPDNGDTLDLYVLGTTSGGANNAGGATTSLIIDITGIGGNAFTADSSLSAPPVPDPLPEPATAALLGAGIAVLVTMRLYKRGRWLPE